MLRTALFFVLFLSAAASVACDDDDTSGDTTLAIRESASACYKQDVAELDRLYNYYLSRLSDLAPEFKRPFIDAQKRWIAFKESDCKYQSAPSPDVSGSFAPITNLYCQSKHTRNRIDDLKFYIDCVEGDMTCPIDVRPR